MEMFFFFFLCLNGNVFFFFLCLNGNVFFFFFFPHFSWEGTGSGSVKLGLVTDTGIFSNPELDLYSTD